MQRKNTKCWYCFFGCVDSEDVAVVIHTTIGIPFVHSFVNLLVFDAYSVYERRRLHLDDERPFFQSE